MHFNASLATGSETRYLALFLYGKRLTRLALRNLGDTWSVSV